MFHEFWLLYWFIGLVYRRRMILGEVQKEAVLGLFYLTQAEKAVERGIWI
jgi:hypothetical protein